VTDLPRRSYPLVVAPPGGFEDAVRRGRRRRRKQTGGSSAAVLVLVGALAYSVVGHPGGGSDRLDQTNQPRIGQTSPMPYGTATPAPFTSSAPTSQHPVVPGSQGGTAQGPRPGGPVAPAGPGVTVSHPAARPPRHNGTTLWPRPKLYFEASTTNLQANCLPAQDAEWCATANGMASGTYYRLSLSICRSVAGGTTPLHVHRKDPVNFQAVDEAHNDKVWTFNLGQPIVPKDANVTVNPGECVMWYLDWDGLDDYGNTPPAGQYHVMGQLFSDEDIPPAISTSFAVD
jgi:hypothetical protein